MKVRSGWDPSVLGSKIIAWYSVTPGSVTQSAGSVSAWAPIMGTGTVTNATQANQPTYIVGGMNGRDALMFNGTSQYLESTTLPALFPIGTTGGEVWAVVDQQSMAANINYIVAYGAAVNGQYRTIRKATGIFPVCHDGIDNVTIPIQFTGRHIIGGRFIEGAGTIIVHCDKKIASTPASNVATATGRFRIGSYIAATASGFFQGLISDVLITQPLQPQQAAELAAWGCKKIGLRL